MLEEENTIVKWKNDAQRAEDASSKVAKEQHFTD
jgi:hypothetical protein